jgi:phage I-like protein
MKRIPLTAANSEPDVPVFAITAINELCADGSLFIPHGDTEVIASNGERVIQRHDAAAMTAMTDAFNSRLARFMRRLKGEVPIFLGHPDMDGAETAFPDKRARGYVEAMNLEAQGLRLAPEWTNLGEALRSEGKYRYPSPRWALEFTGENVSGVRVTRPVKLLSVGMTDRPNIKSVIAYNEAAAGAMVKCEACGDEFDYGAQPETSAGACACPKCGAHVDQTGKKLSAGNDAGGKPQETEKMDKRLVKLLAWLGLAEASNEEQVMQAAEAKLTASVTAANEAKDKAVKDLADERTAWATKKQGYEGTIAAKDQALTAANEMLRTERKSRVEAALVEAVNAGQLTAAQRDERLAAFAKPEKLDTLEAVNSEIAEIGKLPKIVKTASATGDVGQRKQEAELSQQRITAINTAVGEKMTATGATYHDAYLAVKKEKPQLFNHQ